MAALVALDLPLGDALVDALRRCWEAGEAFCVLDPRDSPTRREVVLRALAPTHVCDLTGRYPLESGRGVDSSDAVVVLTSGSTGDPKAAVFTREAISASAQMTSAALESDSAATWYACLPPSHIGGLAVIMRSLVTGRGLIVGAAKDVAAGPERGATHTAVVATLLARHDLSRYERVLVGAGPAPRDRPANVTASWGMTETGSGVVYDGRALPGVEIAVVDGELLVRSATLASRYLHGPLAWTIGPDGSSTWLATGDGARLDEGQLVVTGRLSTMINSGGEKLWPLALERTLQSLPHEGGWVALGEDDPEWGQRLVVVVEGRGDLPALLADARALLAEHHGSAAKPKSIVAVDRIPRTSNGKVKYDELRRLVELSPHRLTAE